MILMLSESRLKSNMHWSTCWLTLVSLPNQYLRHNNKKSGPYCLPLPYWTGNMPKQAISFRIGSYCKVPWNSRKGNGFWLASYGGRFGRIVSTVRWRHSWLKRRLPVHSQLVWEEWCKTWMANFLRWRWFRYVVMVISCVYLTDSSHLWGLSSCC